MDYQAAQMAPAKPERLDQIDAVAKAGTDVARSPGRARGGRARRPRRVAWGVRRRDGGRHPLGGDGLLVALVAGRRGRDVPPLERRRHDRGAPRGGDRAHACARRTPQRDDQPAAGRDGRPRRGRRTGWNPVRARARPPHATHGGDERAHRAVHAHRRRHARTRGLRRHRRRRRVRPRHHAPRRVAAGATGGPLRAGGGRATGRDDRAPRGTAVAGWGLLLRAHRRGVVALSGWMAIAPLVDAASVVGLALLAQHCGWRCRRRPAASVRRDGTDRHPRRRRAPQRERAHRNAIMVAVALVAVVV